MTEVSATNGRFADLIPPEINPQPLLYFGDPLTAEIATIGVNPSAKELTWKRWPTRDLTVEQLDRRLVDYFKENQPFAPHRWFDGYERSANAEGPDKALNVLGRSYRTDTVHLDLSPRPTKAMRSVDRTAFLKMVAADLHWFLSALALCTNVKAAIMSGTVTGDLYFDEFLRKYLPADHSLNLKFAIASGRGATALYTLVGPGLMLPVLFCRRGPSGDNGDLLAREIETRLPQLKASCFGAAWAQSNQRSSGTNSAGA
jgi:hypothetical protein